MGIVNLEQFARRDGDAVGKDGEVQSAGVLGGGMLDPSDAGLVVGEADLGVRRKGEPRNVMLAWELHSQTTLPAVSRYRRASRPCQR